MRPEVLDLPWEGPRIPGQLGGGGAGGRGPRTPPDPQLSAARSPPLKASRPPEGEDEGEGPGPPRGRWSQRDVQKLSPRPRRDARPVLLMFKPLPPLPALDWWTGEATGRCPILRSPDMVGHFLPPPRGPRSSRERGRGAWRAPLAQCPLYASTGRGDPGPDATGRDRLLPESTGKETERPISVPQAEAEPRPRLSQATGPRRPGWRELRAAWGSGPAALAQRAFHKTGSRGEGAHGRLHPSEPIRSSEKPPLSTSSCARRSPRAAGSGRQERRQRHDVRGGGGADAHPKTNSSEFLGFLIPLTELDRPRGWGPSSCQPPRGPDGVFTTSF